ncbi:MAG: GNAT family N-acetyltransferase [Aerococcus sp.]|nr:GNAT family N-acetyltransferase [Aerococcus sp.]
MTLKLVKPTAAYADQVMAFREAMLRNGDSLDGAAGLEDVDTFDAWVDFDRRQRAQFGENFVPSEVYLAIREEDDTLVGIMQYRLRLNPFLEKHGGHIGYSVPPVYRRNGYATEMLGLLLPICREHGQKEVLLTCDKKNIGSRKVIQNNGGVLKDEILEEGRGRITQRFVILL